MSDSMLRAQTDTARKAMLETVVHGIISLSVIASATLLDYHGTIDSAAWAGAVGAGIAVSGAVSAIQGKVGNGHIAEELLNVQIGGRRRTDPPADKG